MDPTIEGHTSSWFRSRRNRGSEKETEKPEERKSFFKRARLVREHLKNGEGSASDSSSETEEVGQPKRRNRLFQRGKKQSGTEASNLTSGASEEQTGAAGEDGEEYQAEDRPRVLAYSDSDSDVETHFKRVKQHLLPPSEEKGEGEGDQSGSGGEEGGPATAGAQADKAGTSKAGKADKPGQKVAAAKSATSAAGSTSGSKVQQAQQQQPKQRQQTRLGSGAGAVLAGVAHHVLPHLTAGFAARLCTLLVVRRLNPSVEDALEMLTIALPFSGAAASRLGMKPRQLPSPVRVLGHEVALFGDAAAAFSLLRLAARGWRRHRANRKVRRIKSLVNVHSLELAADQRLDPPQLPETASEFAQVFQAEVAEMRRMLQDNGIRAPPERFVDAELLRFAASAGLLTAKTVPDRAAAVEIAVRQVVHTVDWLGSQRFLGPSQLRRWDRLVSWRSADAQGHPILLVRVGRALQLVKPERMQDFMDCVITQVDRGVNSPLLSQAAGASRERMVVVLDARGASSLALTRHMALLKHMAVVLNQHYPDRLHRLYLLELPLLLRWAVQVVLPLLHPATRSKVVISSMADPDLPVTVAYLAKRRSTVDGLKRSASEMTLPGSGGSTPSLLSPCQSAGFLEAPQPLSLPPLPPQEAAAGTSAAPSAPTADSEEGKDAPNTACAPNAASRLQQALAREGGGAEGKALRFSDAPTGSAGAAGATNAAAPPPRPSLEAAWDAYMQQAAATSPSRPSTLEAAWDACQQSAAAMRKSFEALGLPPQEGAGAGPSAAPSNAPPADQQREARGIFPLSISTPNLTTMDTSGFSFLPPLHPPHARAPQQPAGGNQGDCAAPFGPAEGGISSHALPLSPSTTLSREPSLEAGEGIPEQGEAIRGLPTAGVDPLLAGAGSEGSRETDTLISAARAADSIREENDGDSVLPSLPPPTPAGLQNGVQEGTDGAEGVPLHPPQAPSDEARPSSEKGATWGSVLRWLGRVTGGGDGTEGLQPGPRCRGGRPPPHPPPLSPSAGQGLQLRPHRLLSLGSSKGGSSTASSPRTPCGLGSMSGLPERAERVRRRRPPGEATPRKPSLRRESSLEGGGGSGGGGTLGSHPVRLQSSVSWAEELESILEIMDTPEAGPPPTTTTIHPPAPCSTTAAEQQQQAGQGDGAVGVGGGGGTAAAALMPVMLLFVLVATLLQRFLLAGLGELPSVM